MTNMMCWSDLTVTNYEDAESRDIRLNKVVGYVCAKCEHYGNEGLITKLVKLHDHKGFLEIHSDEELTAGEKSFFKMAWESFIGDGCDNIEFHVSDN